MSSSSFGHALRSKDTVSSPSPKSKKPVVLQLEFENTTRKHMLNDEN